MSLPHVEGFLTAQAQKRIRKDAVVLREADGSYVLYYGETPAVILHSESWKKARYALFGLMRAKENA